MLETVQLYVALNVVGSVTVRVWVYCAVTRSSNTVSVPSVTVTVSLVQVTVVAGPPVVIQVTVNQTFVPFDSKVTATSPNLARSPGKAHQPEVYNTTLK